MQAQTLPKSNSRKLSAAILAGIMVLYLALAFGSAVTTRPWSDEGWFSNPAYNLVTKGMMGTTVLEPFEWQKGITQHTYWVMPLHILVQAGWYKLFGFSLLSLRAVSMISGLVALAAWLLVIKALSGDYRVAALTVLLIATDYIFITGASFGRMDLMCAALGFAAFAAYLTLRARHFTLAVLVSQSLVAASGMTHPQGFLAFIGLVFLTLYFDRARLTWRQVAIAALPYLVSAVGWGLYIAQSPMDFVSQFRGNAVTGNRLTGFTSPLTTAWDEITRRYLVAFGLGPHSEGRSGLTALKGLTLLAYLAGIVGSAMTRDIRKQKGYCALLILTGIYFVTMMILDGQKLTWYLVHIVPLFAALLATWLLWCWDRRVIPAWAIGACVAGLILLQVGGLAKRMKMNTYRASYLPAVEFIKRHADQQALIMGSAELGFGLGFDRNLVDDIMLGYYSGKRPDFIVVEEIYKDAFRGSENHRQPVYQYITRILTQDYRPVYDQGFYQIYALNSQVVENERRSVTSPDTSGLTRQIATAATASPELPRVSLNTDYKPPTGRTIAVNASGNFQLALDRAQPGDVITLQAGATFTGNFTLPAKIGTGWIVIRSSAPDARLPSAGIRIAPSQASVLPKIVTPNSDAALLTAPGAHHYRLFGLELGIQAGVATNYGIVKLGDNMQRTLESVPGDLIVDRCYIHGNPTGDVSRAIALNSARTAVIDSFISEIHGVGLDTQAICGWNGPGPFRIVNNYLEAAGETFMLGGADPSIPGLIPSDIEFRRNHLYKPLRWRVGDPSYAGIHWSVKNLLEMKNAQRLLIDGNVFENNWGDAQDGFAVVLKSANQDGKAAWSVTRDVTFTNNVVLHSASGINLQGRDPNNPSAPAQRFLIRNNLWEDIDGKRWGGDGRFFQINETSDVTVDHNTVIHTGDVITTYGVASPNFVYTNNISAHNTYGVKGDGTSTGIGTIKQYLPDVVFQKNVLAGGQNKQYPANNLFPASLNEIGFVGRANGVYRLAGTSPFKAAGTDGKDLGCDFDLLNTATSKVVIELSVLQTDPPLKPAAPKPKL